jgi:hypothetical protein
MSNRCIHLHESYRTLLDGSLGWRCARHFVPGYDRIVPPGHYSSLSMYGSPRVETLGPEVHPGYPPTELALKGPPGVARIGSEPLTRIACTFLAPSVQGRTVFFGLPRVQPRAKLSCPFGATPSGRPTYAKQTHYSTTPHVPLSTTSNPAKRRALMASANCRSRTRM